MFSDHKFIRTKYYYRIICKKHSVNIINNIINVMVRKLYNTHVTLSYKQVIKIKKKNKITCLFFFEVDVKTERDNKIILK